MKFLHLAGRVFIAVGGESLPRWPVVSSDVVQFGFNDHQRMRNN
jgi:hypothetical protein